MVRLPLYPKVAKPALLGSMWAEVALAACFVVFRLVFRQKTFQKLCSDDAWVVFALILFFSSSLALQLHIDGLYAQFEVIRGTLALNADVLNTLSNSQRALLASMLCFWTALWSVKFSFWIFFRRLFSRVPRLKVWWWVVLVVLLAGYLTCIGTLDYHCLSALRLDGSCSSEASIKHNQKIFRVHFSADLITDCAIVSIPVLALYNLKVPIKQKLGLIGIFSLTVLVLAISIVRVVLVIRKSDMVDITWLQFWSNMETFVALVVSSLASFRQLYIKSERSKALYEERSPLSTRLRRLLSMTSMSNGESSEIEVREKNLQATTHTKRSRKLNRMSDLTSSSESGFPDEVIQVTTEVEVRSHEADPAGDGGDSIISGSRTDGSISRAHVAPFALKAPPASRPKDGLGTKY